MTLGRADQILRRLVPPRNDCSAVWNMVQDDPPDGQAYPAVPRREYSVDVTDVVLDAGNGIRRFRMDDRADPAYLYLRLWRVQQGPRLEL